MIATLTQWMIIFEPGFDSPDGAPQPQYLSCLIQLIVFYWLVIGYRAQNNGIK